MGVLHKCPVRQGPAPLSLLCGYSLKAKGATTKVTPFACFIVLPAPTGHSYEILFALVLAGDLQDHIAEGEAGAGVDVAEILIRLSAPVGDGGNKHIAGQEP